MLELVNPPAHRHSVAKDWLRFNFQQCGYGGQTYVRNTLLRVRGTAYQSDVGLLTWDLVKPESVKVQAVKEKRRL